MVERGVVVAAVYRHVASQPFHGIITFRPYGTNVPLAQRSSSCVSRGAAQGSLLLVRGSLRARVGSSELGDSAASKNQTAMDMVITCFT